MKAGRACLLIARQVGLRICLSGGRWKTPMQTKEFRMIYYSVLNVEGYVPFNAKKFPLMIGLGEDFREKKVCKTPDEIPRGVDFVILETAMTLENPSQIKGTGGLADE
jgi:hypothetical protein